MRLRSGFEPVSNEKEELNVEKRSDKKASCDALAKTW